MITLLFSLTILASADEGALRSLANVRATAERAADAPAHNAAAHIGAIPFDDVSAASPAALPVRADGPRRTAQALPPRAIISPSDPRIAPQPGRFTGGSLGLYPEGDFELMTGRECAQRRCNAPREGTWYFLDDVIAVPKTGAPALVWIGSNEMLTGATLSADGKSVRLQDGTSVPLSLVPRISTNRSFYDESTMRFFQNRPLRIRGEWVSENGARRFVARTIWPEDYRIDAATLVADPASNNSAITDMVMRDNGGVQSPFQTRLLWQRPGSDRGWAGKPVIGVMVNGAQGDDDDAHVGHFSLFTGRYGPNGEMADWMFSNFYDLDQISEKGILPSLIPMDKYLADLNSGQNYYRPTAIMVAVLKSDRVAEQVQQRYRELYADYYAHKVTFHRTTKPCSSLIIDELRGLSWDIPNRGNSYAVTAGALALMTGVGGMSWQGGKSVWDFMRQEQTRLFPRQAFEAVSGDMLNLAGVPGHGARRELSHFERLLQEDLEAILFVRMPQIPSSRAFGQGPAGDTFEYMRRVPLSRSKWKLSPETGSRPFPPPGAPR